MCYVGKYDFTDFWSIGRIQISQPNTGIYAFINEKVVYRTGGYYLKNNPNYNYHWIDVSAEEIYYVPNSVTSKLTNQGAVLILIGRVQINGQVQIGSASDSGLIIPNKNNEMAYAKNFQILVCDPKPANPCSKFLNLRNNNSVSLIL